MSKPVVLVLGDQLSFSLTTLQQAEQFLDQLETSSGYGHPCHTAGYENSTHDANKESR